MIKQGIAQLLEAEMDRKDFLKTMAVAAVAMTGASAIIKTISNQTALSSGSNKTSLQNSVNSQLGYGMSQYSTPPTTTSPATSSYS